MHYNISTAGLCAAKVAVRNTVRLLSYTKGGKHLGVVDVYTKIPYDLSGSISKNRFRQELCWGISKMFDLFDKEDFCVVFDYKCDIEIHFNDSIEFYQIKTHKITSDAHDGTDRGKSVIMKALYHTMGADCYFEGKWDDSSKTYILRFCVDDDEYYIFRHNKLFKVFDGEKNLLFSVISRHELSERLSSITGFAVKLPPRERNSDDGYIQELEIASAVYNYLLYFVDQDYQNGSQFASFQHLGEYLDYKENVLYYHFGAFDDDYYMLVQEQDILLAEGRRLENEHKMTCMMLDKIYANIHSVSYSKDIKHLRADVNRTRDEYNKLSNALNQLRQKLIRLRNEKADLEYHLHALTLFGKENDLQIASLNNHVCPFCKSEINDAIDLRIKKYSTGDDIILLSSDMQYSIITLTNSKYELLCQKDYDANVSLLRELNNK